MSGKGVCANRSKVLRGWGYRLGCGLMDWQQVLALLIVAMTVIAFAWSKVRRRKFSFAKDTACGCGAGKGAKLPAIGPAQTVVFKARKGERRSVVVGAQNK